ncbi:acyl carrier protein [Streptomyces sp. NPDC056500]|uniref:acyl carrier protein n=1 Tax=Streptomyces sp. NPDC056500 TaxID=3345840 RepID=UPI003677CD91
MSDALTPQELADLMRKNAGIAVEPDHLADNLDSRFDAYGLDSLGLLGIVAALENHRGASMPADAEKCATPREFLALVNNTLTKSGA